MNRRLYSSAHCAVSCPWKHENGWGSPGSPVPGYLSSQAPSRANTVETRTLGGDSASSQQQLLRLVLAPSSSVHPWDDGLRAWFLG